MAPAKQKKTSKELAKTHKVKNWKAGRETIIFGEEMGLEKNLK